MEKVRSCFLNPGKIVQDWAISEDLRLRGQDQGQELEASRPRPRTSKCVLEDVLEAKDVLEDSTSATYSKCGCKKSYECLRNKIVCHEVCAFLRNSINQRWSRGHKARGKGQGHKKNPRSRPRAAFPRTDPLEAKDQGHSCKCSPKKKVFKRFFQAVSNL